MNAQDFCYWLQGFIEMNPNAMLTHTQWEVLKDHLKLVMDKKTPERPIQIGIAPPKIQFPPVAPRFPDDVFNPFKPPVVTC